MKKQKVEMVDESKETVKVVHSEALREIVEQAHMAGQIDAGVDPSYSNARAYYDRLFGV